MVELFVPDEDWSFWEVASPEQAVVAIVDVYGSAAASKAMECMTTACEDGRDDDRRFWMAVYARLHASGHRRPDAV